MKITIEIDGVEVASQTQPATGQARELPAPETQGAAAAGLEEVYARAAAMGAIDAGPASAGEGAARSVEGGQTGTGAPQTFVGGGLAASPTDQSGGAAPRFDLPTDNP